MFETLNTENDSMGQEPHPVSAAPGRDADRRESPGWPAVIAFFIVLGAIAAASVLVPLWLAS